MNAIPTSEEEVDLLGSIKGLQKTTDNFFSCTNVKFWKIIKPVLESNRHSIWWPKRVNKMTLKPVYLDIFLLMRKRLPSSVDRG